MGCSSSLPDRASGRLSGLNAENGSVNDAKNLRVKHFLSDLAGAGDFELCKILQQLSLNYGTLLVKRGNAALAPLYCRGAAVAVVAYDITSPGSFQKAQYWVKVGARGLRQLYFNAYFSVYLFLYSEFWWKLLEIDPQKPLSL